MEANTPTPKPYLLAFERIISEFQEAKDSSGLLSATDYSKNAEAGKATSTKNSQQIQPSVSDFICDVEIAARRSLTETQLAYFKRHYLSANVVVTVGEDESLRAHLSTYPESQQLEVLAFDIEMRQALGKRFVDVELFPYETYMQPVDVRRPAPKKIRWSHLY